MKSKHVLRVKSIRLCRFRGFVNTSEVVNSDEIINTDADIVLLTGPNGFGKTSLIDALCLLLNRHYYEERLPLSSCNEENNSGTFIEAVIKYAQNESDSVKVTVGKNSKNLEIIPSESPWLHGISKELAARCSFFYQDLLGKLFEEENTQVRLLDFLSPKPKNVEEAQKAVKQAMTQWKADSEGILKSFAQKGFPSEGDVNEKRKQAVIDFREAWNELVKAVQTTMQIALPQRDKDWLFLINSKNLRSGWQGELRNFVQECLAELIPEGIEFDKNEKPSAVLSRLKEALSQLRQRPIDQKMSIREKLKFLLDDITNEALVFPPPTWLEKEKEINILSKKVSELEMWLTLFEKLEGHFDNPDGPDFIKVLTALRDQGKIWLEVPEVSPDISPPLSVIEWLRKIEMDDFDRLVDLLEEWKSNISQKRFEFQQNLSDEKKELQNQRMFLDRSREIFNLLEQAGLIVELSDFADSDTTLPSSILKERISIHAQSSQFHSAMERVQEAIFRWIEIEKLNEDRISALQREKGYLKAKEYIDIVSKALEKEAGKNSVLNAAILPPEDVLRKLERIINEILERFRIVEGICPIQLEIKQIKGVNSKLLQIKAANGRPLGAFSTGQKSQLGLALLLGLNYSLNEYIGHNIIALDDVTTVFDMAQLPRTAALIRQIAYAPGDDSTRRQVFIASHHEDLTNRLLDFLIPPEGRELRILNFVKWSDTSGPEIEQRKAIPGLGMSKDNRKKYANIINAYM
jgi:DNA repair exonuclease SbcCD ATPase subunit